MTIKLLICGNIKKKKIFKPKSKEKLTNDLVKRLGQVSLCQAIHSLKQAGGLISFSFQCLQFSAFSFLLQFTFISREALDLQLLVQGLWFSVFSLALQFSAFDVVLQFTFESCKALDHEKLQIFSLQLGDFALVPSVQCFS